MERMKNIPFQESEMKVGEGKQKARVKQQESKVNVEICEYM